VMAFMSLFTSGLCPENSSLPPSIMNWTLCVNHWWGRTKHKNHRVESRGLSLPKGFTSWYSHMRIFWVAW
jgi:hypothetical protein